MMASLLSLLVALILYPVCFASELSLGNRSVWEFGWAYGVGEFIYFADTCGVNFFEVSSITSTLVHFRMGSSDLPVRSRGSPSLR